MQKKLLLLVFVVSCLVTGAFAASWLLKSSPSQRMLRHAQDAQNRARGYLAQAEELDAVRKEVELGSTSPADMPREEWLKQAAEESAKLREIAASAEAVGKTFQRLSDNTKLLSY
jgi:hypothetical protein